MRSLPGLVEIPCNLCHQKAGEIIIKMDAGNFVRCKNCGLFYRAPRFTDDYEINKYQHFVYQDTFCELLNKTKRKLFLSALTKLGPRRGKILDVGCADGYFLTLAQAQGWQPYGTEISDFFINKARENLGERSVSGVPLKMAKFPADFFDVITLWDILDHLVDPVGELEEIKRILKNKGILIIRIRNVTFHLFVARLSKKNNLGFINKPATFHLYGFNKKTIRMLLKKADFFDIKIENSKLTAGDPYAQTRFLGSLGLSIIKIMYYALSGFVSFFTSKEILISPSLIIYARKK